MGLVFMAALFVMAKPAMNVWADEAPNVVFIKDGGTGDGSSADQAASTLITAYSVLDTSKDATIVICGPFTQSQAFDYPIPYDGSVTLTSVYDGVDYREQGAVLQFEAVRYICYGDTRFENLDIVGLGAYVLVVGQHYPVTIGEGVNITAEAMTGGSVAKSFTILGGYQNGAGEATDANDADTNITVLSGSKIYIVAFSRQIVGAYTGTAHITIGGNADVATLHLSEANAEGVILGNTEALITGDAHVGTIYGTTQDTEMNSVKVIWESGTIDSMKWCPESAPGTLTTAEDKLLLVSDKVKEQENYDEIASAFERVETASGSAGTEAAANEETPDDQGAQETEAASDASEAPAEKEAASIPATGDRRDAMSNGVMAAVFCILAVTAAAGLTFDRKRNKI